MIKLFLFYEFEIVRFDGLEKKIFRLRQNGDVVSWHQFNSIDENEFLQVNLFEMLSCSVYVKTKQELLDTIAMLIKGSIVEATNRFILIIPDSMAERLILIFERVLRNHGLGGVTLIRQSGLELIGENIQFKFDIDKPGLIYKGLEKILKNPGNQIVIQNNSEIYFYTIDGKRITILERYESTPISKVTQIEFKTNDFLKTLYTIKIFSGTKTQTEISLLQIKRENVREGFPYLIKVDFRTGFCGELQLITKSGRVLTSDHLRLPSFFYNI